MQIKEVVVVEEADCWYAFPPELVAMIIVPPLLSKVPLAPAFLLGLANFKNRILPVYSLAAMTGSRQAGNYVVVLQRQEEFLGLCVQTVLGIKTVSAGVMQADALKQVGLFQVEGALKLERPTFLLSW